MPQSYHSVFSFHHHVKSLCLNQQCVVHMCIVRTHIQNSLKIDFFFQSVPFSVFPMYVRVCMYVCMYVRTYKYALITLRWYYWRGMSNNFRSEYLWDRQEFIVFYYYFFLLYARTRVGTNIWKRRKMNRKLYKNEIKMNWLSVICLHHHTSVEPIYVFVRTCVCVCVCTYVCIWRGEYRYCAIMRLDKFIVWLIFLWLEFLVSLRFSINCEKFHMKWIKRITETRVMLILSQCI